MRDVESEKLFLFGRRLREGWLAFAMLRAQFISASKRYAESRKKSVLLAKSASLAILVFGTWNVLTEVALPPAPSLRPPFLCGCGSYTRAAASSNSNPRFRLDHGDLSRNRAPAGETDVGIREGQMGEQKRHTDRVQCSVISSAVSIVHAEEETPSQPTLQLLPLEYSRTRSGGKERP